MAHENGKRPAPFIRSAGERYDRIARIYDLMDAPMDWFGGRGRRRRVLGGARGRTLEVGVGTGRNLAYYPEGVRLTGIDVSEKMLARARSHGLGENVQLELADVEHLPYEDDAFDTVTATCVFCSVDDPVQGLNEVRRVVRPEGQVLLLEHVRPRNRVLGWIFDVLNRLTRRVGPEINRRTEANVQAAGLKIVDVRRDGIWREIRAVPAGADRDVAGAGRPGG